MEENREFDGLELEGLDVEEVAADTPTSGTAHRDPAGGALFPSGRMVLNADGTDDFYAVVQARGYERENSRVSYGRVTGTDVVAIYARRNGEPGTADVRLNADGKTVTLYLHSLLEKHPSLRPTTTKQCKLSWAKDKKGVPCLVFHANGGLDKRSQKRGSGGGGDQAAPGKQQ
jgi:hypothetical protein